MTDLARVLNTPGTSLAIVGATDRPGKYGGIIYRDMKAKGFTVYGVNPYRDTVDGDECWPSVKDLPETPTIAVFVIPAKRGMGVIDDCEEAGIENLWIQPGAFSEEMRDRLESSDFNWLAEACVMVQGRRVSA
jgi:predicted CoA-binding protein